MKTGGRAAFAEYSQKLRYRDQIRGKITRKSNKAKVGKRKRYNIPLSEMRFAHVFRMVAKLLPSFILFVGAPKGPPQGFLIHL
jgi:hypothetical protein